jgi:hypothetical protein
LQKLSRPIADDKLSSVEVTQDGKF